jgi:predicted phosphodiesterase
MQRRKFIGSLTGGAVLGSVAAAEGQDDAARSGPLVTTPAVVMAPREDGAEVVWAVSELAKGWVEWKGADGSEGRAAADAFGFVPQGEEILRVRLEGLKPGVSYEVRAVTEAAAGGRRDEGAWKKFRTLDPAAAAARFAVWNDTHENAETLAKLHEVTPAVDFLIWNGDTCNDWHRRESLAPILLNPGGQDISDGRPMLMVWGNHDVRGKWAYRAQEMIATPRGRPFYAFRSGPVAVLCLHTGEDKPDDHPSFGGRVAFEDLRREQAAWLDAVTARPEFRDAPYRVVFCHIPLRWTTEVADAGYEKGGYDIYSRASRELWHEALVRWKAQVVISGHTHQAAHLPASEDFPYAQLTGGGPQPERATVIEGAADAGSLRLSMRNLGGETLHEIMLKPVG